MDNDETTTITITLNVPHDDVDSAVDAVKEAASEYSLHTHVDIA